MSRLFWKLFSAFWVAMILIAVVAAITTSQLARGWQERAAERREQLVTLSEEAQAALTAEGLAGLEAWLRDAVAEQGDYLYVLAGNRDLLGRVLPFPVDGFDPDRSRRGGRPPFSPGRRMPPPPDRIGRDAPTFERAGVAMRMLVGSDGQRYRVVSDLELRPLMLFKSPLALALRLGITVLVSGGVALVLARYLTSPLLGLRQTTRRFTAGDLDARVEPGLAGRRDEIGDLAREFDEMAERLGLLLTSQRRLLGDLSHELRSPLARLQVALELARKRSGDTADAELSRIELEAERLNHLIGEILALVRLESSPHRLERVPVDLQELLESVVADANFECRPTDREVRLDAAGIVPVAVNDEVLRRALDNIVRNAIRYTPAGRTVDVSLVHDREQARIRVRDHGPGAAESALPHLFEAFYRDDDSRALDTSGTGIGLAIAKRAVEVHGGTITAHNAKNGGLEIEIRLPLAPSR